MDKEGVIKFQLEWKKTEQLPEIFTRSLTQLRDTLHAYGLIGEGKDGIGFGNASLRMGNVFIITGTQTGGLRHIGPEHIAIVTRTDIEKNAVFCEGPIKASSEALTHGAIYDAIPSAMAVIHIHSRLLWERFKGTLPTTDPSIAYGTPDLAREIARLYKSSDLRLLRILVVGGHKDGLFIYGHSSDEALETVLGYAEI